MTGRTLRGAMSAGILVVALLAGCGDDDASGDPAAQPAPANSQFTEGEFDEIPLFRGASPIQKPTTMDGTTTGSFTTDRGSPETAIRFYEENLPELGWSVVDPVVETSNGVWRGDWLRDGRRLQVITSDLSPNEGDATDTQIDLVLLATSGDEPVATVPRVTSG